MHEQLPEAIPLKKDGMKHHDQKQVGEERVYLAYASTLEFITKGSQDRNLEAEADAEVMEG